MNDSSVPLRVCRPRLPIDGTSKPHGHCEHWDLSPCGSGLDRLAAGGDRRIVD